MPDEVVPMPDEPEDDDLEAYRRMPLENLMARFVEQLDISAKAFMMASRMYVVLKHRGADFTGIRNPYIPIMDAVASGRLLPEMIHKFYLEPSKLTRLSRLSLEDQKTKIIGGEPVTVVERNPATGEVSGRKARLADLAPSVLDQVIDRDTGRIRDDREQAGRLIIPAKPVLPDVTRKHGKTTVDRIKGVVKVGGAEDRIENVKAALREAGEL